MSEKVKSPEHKRGRHNSPLSQDAPMAPPADPGFLLHEEQLALLQLQTSLV